MQKKDSGAMLLIDGAYLTLGSQDKEKKTQRMLNLREPSNLKVLF
jgi:hypothetical protein